MNYLNRSQQFAVSASKVNRRCVVIGTTGLCVSVLEQLVERDWLVLGVVSQDISVRIFCENHNIPLFNRLLEIKFQNFFLFSVANYQIIPETFLKKSSVVAAINYHDSLLPKYAGVHSTTWAIHNGETKHGVTWHLIVSGIDEGAILEQSPVVIESNETALSLNLKCSHEAEKLFARVLDRLDSGEIVGIEQDVSCKTYYGKAALPRNYGFIDFEASFEEIDRLCRSLDFGEERVNPVASLKIWDGERVYLLENVVCTADKAARAGYIYYASGSTIKVGIQGGVLSAGRVKTIDGKMACIDATRFSIGRVIPHCLLTDEECQLLSAMKRKESSWEKHVAHPTFQGSFFHEILCDTREYTQTISLKKSDNQDVIEKIALLLHKCSTDDLQISVYAPLLVQSQILQNFVHERGYLLLNRDLSKVTYGKFIDLIQTQLSKKDYLAGDLFYRYQLRPPLSDVAILLSSDVVTSVTHRLTFTLTENQIELRGSLGDKVLIDSLVQSLKDLVRASPDQDQYVHALSIVSGEDYHALISGGQRRIAETANLIEMFEKQVEKTPDAVAIVFQEQLLTYHTLNQRVNQLCRQMVEAGLAEGSLVALALDRSFELVIALLAVLKAGCSYLPLDVNHPRQRIEWILQNAEAKGIISKKTICDDITFTGAQLLLDDESVFQGDELFVQGSWDENTIAYVLYTSGSTGHPKGVEISRGALASFFGAIQEHIQISASDRCLALTTVSFDIAQLELLLPLLHGAAIVLADDAALADPQLLRKLIDSEQITYAQATPTTWQMLIEAGWKNASDLKILCGGEALSSRLCRELLQCSDFVWNLYGPTEATIWSTIKRLEYEKPVTIGKPLANTRCYILDEYLNVVPTGVVGELYLGGQGLAKGYRNNSELTHECFISSPKDFASKTIYKTGDRARFLPNGEIEYLGRVDNQVKIRGLRIELEEIEVRMEAYSGVVMAAAVVSRSEERGDLIVAYYSGECSERLLQEFLQKQLPSYMLPSRYVRLKHFPLTTSGKIDRKALSLKDLSEDITNYIKPENEVEERVIQFFQNFLGIEKLSMDANFFALGGHSLLAFRAVAGLNRIFDIQLPMRTLFEYPVMKTMAQQVDNALQVTKRCRNIPVAPKLPNYPLSCTQQQFWFLSEQLPSSALYSIPLLMTIEGELDLTRLKEALEQLVNRHDSLRVVFCQQGEEACQQVLSQVKVEVDCFQIEAGKERLEQAIRKTASEPFDLLKGPLFRFTLFRQGKEKSYLLLNFSHLIFDGFSIDPLLLELKALYEGDELPSLPLRYMDFAIWQQHTPPGPPTPAWLKELSEAPPALNLPLDYPRPVTQTYAGATLDFSLNSEGLSTLAREHATTPFTVLLSLFHILLYKYTQQSDFVIGVPTSGRTTEGLIPLLGCFTNPLPIRTLSDSHETFVGLLHGVKHQVNEAFQNEHIPFAKILDELKLHRVSGQSPLYQVMFNLLPKNTVQEIDGQKICVQTVDRGYAHLDLSLTMQQREEDYIGTLEYNTDLLSREKMVQFAKHFQRLASLVVQNPETKIAEIDLLSDTEKEIQLVQWNAPALDYHKEKSFLTEIETWAEKTPGHVALVCGKTRYTFEQMNTLANRVAHHLLDQGVTPEAKVALCLDRSAEFIAALLGALKIGAVYVPIDPRAPKERKEFLLQELNPAYVMNKKDFGQLPTHQVENPVLDLPENRLAYVIFTSGSTGIPKGVEIEYRSINDRVMWKSTAYPLNSKDVALHAYSFIFDGAIINYLWPLCSGSTLVIATQEELMDSAELVKLIRKWKVSTVDMLPSLLDGLVEDELHTCSSLRRVFSGGEALDMDLVTNFYKKCGARLYNTYGPTEATVEATVWECTGEFNEGIAPLGKPIADTQLYVLDRDQNDVPVGVPGELYIGGTGLARGYLNDPELTRQRFVSIAGRRLYRTGDLVKYQSDGTLIFLGRMDSQIKVRGFRVDLTEIESAMRLIDDVETAVVLPKGDALHKKLVAYVKLGERKKMGDIEQSVKNFLDTRLPSYMIPQSVTVLDAFPTLPNGKLDYKAFPQPKSQLPKPRTRRYKPLEYKLLKIWEEVLEVQGLSITDNFFDSGGTSLLAMRLIAKIKRTLGISAPITDLLLHPTIEKLAKALRHRSANPSSSPIVQMSSKGKKTPFFCVHPIGGNVLCYNTLVQNWGQDRPFYAIQASGLEDDQKPKETITEMAKEYIKAMRNIQPKGPYIIGGWSFGGLIAVEMAYQLTQEGEKVSNLVLIDSNADISKLQQVNIRDESELLSELTSHFASKEVKRKPNLTVKEHLARFIDNGGRRAISRGKTMVDKLVGLAQANYRALQSFCIPKIDVRVTLIRSEENPEKKTDLGWTDYTNQLNILHAPGDHWAITQKKFAPHYARLLRDCLSK